MNEVTTVETVSDRFGFASWWRGDGACLGALGVGFSALYGTTLCRTVYWSDSAEFVAAAKTLGIPHPPGYPLYTLLGKVFTLLPLPPALAVNSMSLVFGVVGVLLSFVVSRELGASRLGSLVGAALLGLGSSYWKHSTIAEVYTPAMTFLLLALWCALLGVRTGRARWCAAAGLVAGLGLGMHLSLATTGLAFVALVFASQGPSGASGLPVVRRWLHEVWRSTPRALGAGAAALLGFSIFLYLPLRARMNPAMNFGDPRDLEAWLAVVGGGVYRYWFGDAADPLARALRVLRLLMSHVMVSGLLLAPLGLWRLLSSRRLVGAAWGLGIFGNLAYFYDYQVYDLEVFFLPSATLASSLIAFGIDQILHWLRNTPMRHWVAVASAAGLTTRVALAYGPRDLSDYDAAYVYGEQLSERLPAGAVMVTFTSPAEWKYDMVFRWYFQLVLQRRPDVFVMVLPHPDAVRQVVDAGHQVFAYLRVPALEPFELVPEENIAPKLVRILSQGAPHPPEL